MKKDVLLVIESLQIPCEGPSPDPVSLCLPAAFYERNGYTWLTYREFLDGDTEEAVNFVKFKEGHLQVRKTKAVSVTMDFRPGCMTESLYQTPYASFLLGMDTESVRIEKRGEALCVEAVYDLYMEKEKQARCLVSLTVKNLPA